MSKLNTVLTFYENLEEHAQSVLGLETTMLMESMRKALKSRNSGRVSHPNEPGLSPKHANYVLRLLMSHGRGFQT